VFGHVLSGQEVVSHIEGLPVDRMCRPLQDAKVINCGELVLKTKTRGNHLFIRVVKLFRDFVTEKYQMWVWVIWVTVKAFSSCVLNR
jgi:hypothetical protein